MYAKTDKPDHLSKWTVTQNVKVDKSQCSLKLTNSHVCEDRQTYKPPI